MSEIDDDGSIKKSQENDDDDDDDDDVNKKTTKPSTNEKTTDEPSTKESIEEKATATTKETTDEQSTKESTEEPTTASSFVGGWFSSIVETAKQTVVNNKTTIVESIRRDLNELKDAVQMDTATSMLSSTASLVKQTINEIGNTVIELGSLGTNQDDDDNDNELKQLPNENKESNDDVKHHQQQENKSTFESINEWLTIDNLSEKAKITMNLMKDTIFPLSQSSMDHSLEELDMEPYLMIDSNFIKINNWNNELRKLQLNKKTFTHEPEGPPDIYEQWLCKFNLFNYQKQMKYLLLNINEMNKYYQQLVPETLSDSDFWHRYYYNVYQLRERLIDETRTNYYKNLKEKNLDKDDVKDDGNKNENKDKNENDATNNNHNKTPSQSSTSSSASSGWEKMTTNNNGKNKGSSSVDDVGDWVKM